MECARCHAVIAEKAIVCYRCGTPTAVPVAPPRKTAPAGTPLVLIVSLLLVALVTGAVAWAAEPGGLRTGLWVASALALLGSAGALWRRPG